MKSVFSFQNFIWMTIVIFLQTMFSCSKSNEVVVTQYETTYTISLDSIPQQIQLDSGFVDIYVNGELWKRVDWSENDLSNDQIHFLITTLKGENIQIQYALYSKGLAIASGTDEYDPENQTSSNSAGLLIRHTEVIETILEELNGVSSSAQLSSSSEIPILSSETMSSSSSSENSSSSQSLSSSNLSSSMEASSSSSAWQSRDFSVSILANADSILEGQSVTLQIQLLGPEGAALPNSAMIQLQKTGANGDVDYSMLTSTTLSSGMIVGATKNIQLITVGNDNLVEGTETVSIVIGDAGELSIHEPSALQVRILDTDSAKVEFATTFTTAREEIGLVTVPVRLVTVPATATLSLPLNYKTKVDSVKGNVPYSATLQTGQFTAGQGNGQTTNVSYTIGSNSTFNEFGDRRLRLGIEISSGPGSIGSYSSSNLYVSEYNFEYWIASDGSQDGGVLYVYRPIVMNQLEYVTEFSLGGAPFTELTTLGDGKIMMLREGQAFTADLTSPTPILTPWSNRTDIADIDYGTKDGFVWVVTNSGLLFAYNTNGLTSTADYPKANAQAIMLLETVNGIKMSTSSLAKGGVVFTTSNDDGMTGCTDYTGSAFYISTTTNNLPDPNYEQWASRDLLIGNPEGIVVDPNTNQIRINGWGL